MKFRAFNTLAGSSLLMIASAAVAQTPAAGTEAAPVSSFELEEIIVTARRKDESLQDVPQTVNAVTGATLEKLNILRFEDLQAVSPGLTLSSGNNGYTTAASVRGVTFNVETGASPTTEFYMNDAPVESAVLFQSMFDVGQIEVLRGPQGTLRGRSAPSGAITLTTRKANLTEFGGNANATATNLGTTNFNGALNLPIISDVLAIRVAGITEKNDFDGVRSVTNPMDPESRTNGGRASVTFRPFDTLLASVSYNKLVRHLRAYNQVAGAGGAGGTVANTGVVLNPGITSWAAPAAGFNGPVIAAGDRLSVVEGRGDVAQTTEVLNGQLDWSFLGQKLSYVGSYMDLGIIADADTDTGNYFANYGAHKQTSSQRDLTTNELRLSSEERIWERLDYTVGVFHQRTRGQNRVQNGPSYQRGAFGSPFAAPVLGIPNNRFKIDILIDGDNEVKELSEFANLTWHFTDATELAVGGRYIHIKPDNLSVLRTSSGFIALPPAALGLPSCGAAGFASTYPGACDVPIAAGNIQALPNKREGKQFIYNVAFSHRFTDDYMAYFNTGTAFRAGPTGIGITNGGNDPVLNELTNLKNEESVSYELGTKLSFLDKRIRLNVAAYHQEFENLITQTNNNIYYLSNSGGGRTSVSQFLFNYNADAIVDGVDVDASWQVLPHWNIGATYAYADGHLDDQPAPCNDSNFDGVPDSGTPTTTSFTTAGKAVALCQSNDSVSRAPLWNAALQSEYSLPVMANMEAFVRGLYTYYPENKRRSPNFVVDSYGLLNVYAGVRSPDSAWELSVFAKNASNTGTALSRSSTPNNSTGGVDAYFGPSGYYDTTYTPRREVGVNVRYAFGSR